MGRGTAKADGKQKSAEALQAAKTEAKRQLEAALGFSKAVKLKVIAQQHGVGITTLRAHVVGHAGSAPRAQVGGAAPPCCLSRQRRPWPSGWC
jgi:hypothetical protein